jgi:hypothetical protein
VCVCVNSFLNHLWDPNEPLTGCRKEKGKGKPKKRAHPIELHASRVHTLARGAPLPKPYFNKVRVCVCVCVCVHVCVCTRVHTWACACAWVGARGRKRCRRFQGERETLEGLFCFLGGREPLLLTIFVAHRSTQLLTCRLEHTVLIDRST